MESIGKAYKPWMIASVAVLVVSLVLLITAVSIGFIYYSETSQPLWIVVMGVIAVLGIGVGFGGFFVLMLAAAWFSFRERRRVQVISPDHSGKE